MVEGLDRAVDEFAHVFVKMWTTIVKPWTAIGGWSDSTKTTILID